MTRQVSARKANGSEPRMLCRKRLNRHRNQVDLAAWDQVQQEPVYGLDGDRQIGGASLVQAFMRNLGTWRFDAKGRTQVGGPHES
jgi:hypothetical protein